jgi:hypothetical protein
MIPTGVTALLLPPACYSSATTGGLRSYRSRSIAHVSVTSAVAAPVSDRVLTRQIPSELLR